MVHRKLLTPFADQHEVTCRPREAWLVHCTHTYTELCIHTACHQCSCTGRSVQTSCILSRNYLFSSCFIVPCKIFCISLYGLLAFFRVAVFLNPWVCASCFTDLCRVCFDARVTLCTFRMAHPTGPLQSVNALDFSGSHLHGYSTSHRHGMDHT